jgi:hypothetical protein
MSLRKLIIKALLAILNSRWLNCSPCRYGFIGNVDAFEYSHLASEERQRPGIAVKTILEEADRFSACPINKGRLTVLESDGSHHEATVFDLRDLRESFAPKDKPE